MSWVPGEGHPPGTRQPASQAWQPAPGLRAGWGGVHDRITHYQDRVCVSPENGEWIKQLSERAGSPTKPGCPPSPRGPGAPVLQTEPVLLGAAWGRRTAGVQRAVALTLVIGTGESGQRLRPLPGQDGQGCWCGLSHGPEQTLPRHLHTQQNLCPVKTPRTLTAQRGPIPPSVQALMTTNLFIWGSL